MAAPAILIENLEEYFPPARSGWRAFAHRFARGYCSAFLLEILEALFGVATFYYLSRFVESPELSRALPQGSSYFAFALIGFAFFDYLGVALNAFDSSIEEARPIPIAYSLEGIRAALLGGASFRELWSSILALLIFAVILLPLSFLTFAWALRRTKTTGTLTHI